LDDVDGLRERGAEGNAEKRERRRGRARFVDGVEDGRDEGVVVVDGERRGREKQEGMGVKEAQGVGVG
jgi:hypothetical protein